MENVYSVIWALDQHCWLRISSTSCPAYLSSSRIISSSINQHKCLIPFRSASDQTTREWIWLPGFWALSNPTYEDLWLKKDSFIWVSRQHPHPHSNYAILLLTVNTKRSPGRELTFRDLMELICPRLINSATNIRSLGLSRACHDGQGGDAAFYGLLQRGRTWQHELAQRSWWWLWSFAVSFLDTIPRVLLCADE